MGDSSFASGFKTGFGSAFLQFAFERLADFGSFAWKEIGLVLGVEDELRKFQRTFLKIQDLVDHVESSPLRFSGGSKAWQTWFEDLRKLAYDADALLDHVSLNLSTYCTKHSVSSHQENQVRPMILSSLQLDLPGEISKMQKKLDDLANEMKSLLKIEKVKMDICKHKTGKISYSGATYSSTSLLAVDDGAIVGRQQDKDNIVELLDEKYDDEVSVVPLVGMGGVGKTTLARLIFNDKKACYNYKLKIWISVSADFDVVRITKSMIESATEKTCYVSELDLLQRNLHQILISEGKFLLVLDDYWNENHDDWELLSLPFRSIFNGSKVIVTTRSSTVAKIVGSTEAYNLQVLSDDDCWRLMKQRAFFKRDDKEELELLGKEIAKKCDGLPLAAKTLGSVLHHQSTEDEWNSILRSDLWDLPQYENGVFPCLMLSYLHLPAHLQKCFAYCSIFPQNHEFEVEELVHVWMAEGFIQLQGQRRLEDIGSDYFDDLYSRSFFIQELKAALKNERLRTFLVMCKNGVTGGLIDHELFFNLKFLRVLDLSNIGLNALPDSIDHLIYLRYLNLCGNRFQYLPRSMCKLLVLQTLKLRNCPELVALPSDLKKLSNLRHLIFDVGGKLSFMPPELGRLTNLQTLSAFVARKQARNAKLETKSYLNKLVLQWEELSDGLDQQVRDQKMQLQAQVFTNLEPHKNLKELEIRNYSGIRCPDWLGDSTRKFTTIHLHGLGCCRTLPSFGQLPLLKSLHIGEMDALESVDHNFYGDGNAVKFPLLELLEVYQMPELVQWMASDGSISMPCLTTLRIDDCPNLTSLPPNLQALPDSNISRCPRL
ncbi:UNVERIFIED_CONTAM: putative disease resistance RPP13-like protein 1 [Sesamum angustifolium]|uniref:Disease resistance RPP13-like protein 1 n=1 Tax=Sesamum angustifolium TaxID=2727405 RepID=A0AAW2PW68_9LAMI